MKAAAKEILFRIKDAVVGNSWTFTAPPAVQKSGFDTLRILGSFSNDLWLVELGNIHFLTLPHYPDDLARRRTIAYFDRAGFLTPLPHAMHLSNNDAEAYLLGHFKHEPENVSAFQHARSICDRTYQAKRALSAVPGFMATPHP